MKQKISDNGDAATVIAPSSADLKIDAASQPTVNNSGQVFWSVRDILFSPSRVAAAETIKRAKSEAE
jgi:hypothetical protein